MKKINRQGKSPIRYGIVIIFRYSGMVKMFRHGNIKGELRSDLIASL